jgi:hypothetical protein
MTPEMQESWDRVRRCVEFHNPTLDGDLARIELEINALEESNAKCAQRVATLAARLREWIRGAH